LIDFLERESRQHEVFKSALEAIARIGSLVSAETEARAELEAAQADLAWAKAELESIQNTVVTAKEAVRQEIEGYRVEMEEEANHLKATVLKERDTLSKITRCIEAAQAAAGLIAKTLREESLLVRHE
jgi:outer membrane protein TolC